MKIVLTGVGGAMGTQALQQIMQSTILPIEWVRVLVTTNRKHDTYCRDIQRQYGNKLQLVRGSIVDKDLCADLVQDADYVVNMAAVIPPKSDMDPMASYNVNYLGACYLADAVKAMPKPAKYIHISTVAVYGNRTQLHPYGRVGDPLMPSAFDEYAKHKKAAEMYVLDLGLPCWVVLRQTATIYPALLMRNVSNGLMYHTPLNAPLEWVSDRDSGRLICRILERDVAHEIDEFWRKIYNIGGGEGGRGTGYNTFLDGLAMIGGSPKKFLRPHWFATGSFHGVWFADSYILEDYFAFRRDTAAGYWKEIGDAHPAFGLAKLVPSSLISALVFRPLLADKNAPRYWLKHEPAKVKSVWGSKDTAKALPKKWSQFTLWAEQDDFATVITETCAQDPKWRLQHGYDESKPMDEWTIVDMRQAAEFRGGRCLSPTMEKGQAYRPLTWQCHQGHVFQTNPYTVLRGGHWCPVCCGGRVWQYDELSKHIPFYAQVWYDDHVKGAGTRYYFDRNHRSHCDNVVPCGRKAAIYAFSGTGNTRKVCDALAQRLTAVGWQVDVHAIRTPLPTFDPAGYDRLIVGYPVHGFNAPKPVEDWIAALPKADGMPVYLMQTSGEPLRLNNGMVPHIGKLLRKRGYQLMGDCRYVMPYNIIFRHSDGMAARMWQAAQKGLDTDAEDIAQGLAWHTRPTAAQRLVSGVVRIEHPAMPVLGCAFHTSDDCTGCGLCAYRCPMNNIRIRDGHARFGHDCVGCMGCAFSCPKDAVRTGVLNAWRVNGAYRFQQQPAADEELCHYWKGVYRRYFHAIEDILPLPGQKDEPSIAREAGQDEPTMSAETAKHIVGI